MVCTHLDSIREITPSADACEGCLKTGDSWVHLRVCRQGGHVVCCDRAKTDKRPGIILRPVYDHESYNPPGPWGWCYIDQEMLDFSGSQTIHRHAHRLLSRIVCDDGQSH